MTDELVDIVNERGEVAGTIMKSQAHREGVLHPIAVVFVFVDGKMIVQRRVPKKNGLLDHSVAGHVPSGTDVLASAHREAEEELGLKDLTLAYVGATKSEPVQTAEGVISHYYTVYETEISDAQFQSIRIQADEIANIALMSLAEIEKAMKENDQDFSGGFKATFELYHAKRR
jgi:isopentenyldiphosphate isomerase